METAIADFLREINTCRMHTITKHIPVNLFSCINEDILLSIQESKIKRNQY